jgi:precorrin-4 methylase
MRHGRRSVLFLIAAALLAAWLLPTRGAAWGRGHFYVIGTGPAGPDMATLQAIETIKRMDVILAPAKHVKLFEEYVGDKPVPFDPWEGRFSYKGKPWWKLANKEKAEFEEARERVKAERVRKIREYLDRGKDVGLLDSGNPCLFGPGHWLVEEFGPDEVIIIPGMGCDAAAMAALGRSTIPAHQARFVLQSAPFFMMDWNLEDRQILKDLGKYPFTMIQYMALRDPEKLFNILREVLEPDVPCAVVFWAGYPDKERIVRGTIADMGQKLANDKERFMGLLLIGRFLEGRPYQDAIKFMENQPR